MTDYYVDRVSGDDGNLGTSWATAFETLTKAASVEAAEDRIFCKANGSGGPVENVSSEPGLSTGGTMYVACKTGTTNEGDAITKTDLLKRGDADQPQFDKPSGGGYQITGVRVYWHGYHVTRTATDSWIGAHSPVMQESVLASDGLTPFSASGSWILWNCTYRPQDAGSTIYSPFGTIVEWFGGELDVSVAAPTNIVNSGSVVIVAQGIDLSGLAGKALMAGSTNGNARVILRNCKMPSSYTKVSSGFSITMRALLEMVGCTDDVSLGDEEAVLQYHREDCFGVCMEERTKVRSGGADDGVSGGFSFKLLGNPNSPRAPAFGATTPWMNVWVDGDGSSQDFTVYIANDGAGDLNKDEIEFEVFYPSASGSARYDRARAHGLVNRGSASPAADDSGSTWGGGVGNHQKLVVTTAPDFDGVAYGRVILSKRQSVPDAVYVDAKIHVS